MRKYISFISAVLIFISASAQQDRTVISARIKAKSHLIAQLQTAETLSWQLPASAVLHEFHDGNKLFSARSTRSKLNGNWQSWYRGGHSCDSGRLVNNLPDGEWKYWDEQGNLVAVRTYNAEKFHRVNEEIQRYNPRRSFYMISTLSQRNRSAALHYLSSSYSFSIPGKNYASLAELVRSNTNGSGEYQPVFASCLHDGLYMNFFVNGHAKDSGYYKDGLRFGKWVHRETASGHYWEGAYQDGQKIKEWKRYDSAGKLKEIVVYKLGEIHWRKGFND